MPRIDPSQLLKCLSVLLSSSGGIKSKDEVNRVANLMTKFSKKLVSKCIYVLILKSTEVDILDMFMSADGWDLVFNWLSDGIAMKNWSLVEEIVELLLLCPVNIQRLKGNNCPKIIKSLSKDTSATEKVRELACEVVEQWLAIVKGACEATSSYQQQQVDATPVDASANSESTTDAGSSKEVYKITIRDGKQILAEVVSDKTGSRIDDVKKDDVTGDSSATSPEQLTASGRPTRKGKPKGGILDDLSESETDSSDEDFKVSKSRKRIKSLKSPKPTARKTKLSEVKKQSSKEKDVKEEKKKAPTIVRSRVPEPSSKSESKKSETTKVSKHDAKTSKLEREMLDKDRATLAKLVTPSISSMGRIPKKSKDKEKEPKKDEKKDVKKEEKKPEKKPVEPPKPVPKDPKKYNYSTEIRKHDNERPKTVVKTFNSKFRSTGLEDTPPPPKTSKSDKSSKSESEGKKSPKRGSPLKDVVPEKKAKLSHDDHHKPKQVKEDKITSPKPKSLQECDLFGVALIAANDFKDQKKRKRRPSNSSSGTTPSGKESPPKKLHSIKEEVSDDEGAQAPSHTKKADTKPNLRFYQDTMETDVKSESDKKSSDVKKEVKVEDSDLAGGQVDDKEIADEIVKTEEAISKQLKMEDIKNQEREKNRVVSGILVYVKKTRGVSKSVQWRPQHALIQTKYFELDETERVNVTKTFMDMKQMERTNEREQLMLSRKLALNDVMEERIMWRPLIAIDIPGDIVENGKNSLEKDIQMQRERTVVPAIYFNKKLIPDSPAEPDLEIHALTEPIIIPLVDQTGNTESVISYKSQGWPEPVETPQQEQPILPPPVMPLPEIPPMAALPPGPIPPILDFGPPAGFFPGQMGGMGQAGPPPGMIPPGAIPPMWVNGDGTPMMAPPPDMMMGPPQPGVMPPQPGVMPPPEIAAQFGMGPMGPPFMGPPPSGFNQAPPPMFQDGPPPPRNNRPWNNNYQGGGGGGGGQWRKGRGRGYHGNHHRNMRI